MNVELKRTMVTEAITGIIANKYGRKLLVNQADKQISKLIEKSGKEYNDLDEVIKHKQKFISSMLYSATRNLDKGYISSHVIKKLCEVLVRNSFITGTEEHHKKQEDFKEKYGTYPPSFIVLSPTQRCNLHCSGCYASSDKTTATYLSYNIVDRIVSEVHDKFDSRFITISGGEPFLYRSNGKTLLDIFEKYNDMFFLVYTNGTLITPEIAQKLERLGNATPAISVEGYEKETDQRRGQGVHKKILDAFKNLRKAGVPFGISVTATDKNKDILLSDEFYQYYFDQQGVTYMWQFQLMPIGRGKKAFDLIVKPKDRVKLYKKWEVLTNKKYCMADFWNNGILSNGCIAYGRKGGYVYIDWDGNIMPCVFVPYYVDNVLNLYKNGKSLADGLYSNFMKNGRKWQNEYGLYNPQKAGNWLMPCSIRDHFEIFKKSIVTKEVKGENQISEAILHDDEYFNNMKKYDEELEDLTEEMWRKDFLKQAK